MKSHLQTPQSKIARLASVPRRLKRRLDLLLQGRLRCCKLALSLVEGKNGIEIGGPSDVFREWQRPTLLHGPLTPLPIYDRVGSLDNCNFSAETIWSSHLDGTYQFSLKRPAGKTIIAEGTNLSCVAEASYDFVLSSHNLEHFANPVKALREWKRVTRANGGLILVLPDYRRTFDHHRTPTPVEHMLEDYSRDVGEDDSTHIPEVLELHDVEMDGTLKTRSLDELRVRSINNASNRCLHHHVFDESNSSKLLEAVGLKILAIERAVPYHIFIISQWKS